MWELTGKPDLFFFVFFAGESLNLYEILSFFGVCCYSDEEDSGAKAMVAHRSVIMQAAMPHDRLHGNICGPHFHMKSF